jgi:hypothetical protein
LFVVASSVVTAYIYWEDVPKVIMPRNRLGLSLSKRINSKINGKMNLWTNKALGQILTDHSCARRAPELIPSSHHTS